MKALGFGKQHVWKLRGTQFTIWNCTGAHKQIGLYLVAYSSESHTARACCPCSETTRAKKMHEAGDLSGPLPSSAHIIASSILTRFQAITPVKRGGVFGAGIPGRNYVPRAHMTTTPDQARGKRGNILQTKPSGILMPQINRTRRTSPLKPPRISANQAYDAGARRLPLIRAD